MVFFGELDQLGCDFHLEIFTRCHTQLTLGGGEEVLREEEVKDVEGDEDEDDDEGEDGDVGALASSSSVVRKSRGESNGQRPEKRPRQNSIQT